MSFHRPTGGRRRADPKKNTSRSRRGRPRWGWRRNGTFGADWSCCLRSKKRQRRHLPTLLKPTPEFLILMRWMSNGIRSRRFCTRCSVAPATAWRRLANPVPPRFRAQLKHLLELDRNLGASPGHPGSKPVLAFHDALPQGKGNDALFSPENALSLAVALECLKVGFPQKAVVELMGKLRPQLGTCYSLVNSVRASEGGTISTEVEEGQFPTTLSVGDPGVEVADITEFLVLRSFELAERPEAEVIRGKEKLRRRFNWLFPHRARSVVVIELSDIATRLKELFDRVPPKRRGRSATRSSK